MEALKETFNNLSKSEQRKFLEEIVWPPKLNEVSHSESLNEKDINRQILTSGQKKTSEDNSSEVNSEGDSRKKQKTLDSWLIKRDGSSSKDKLVKSPCKIVNQDSNLSRVDNLSENNADSSNIIVSIEDPGTSSSFHTVCNDKSPSNLKDAKDKSEKGSKTLKIETSEINTLVTEKYNLRSNRKKSSVRSPIKKSDSYSEKDRKEEVSPPDSTNDINCYNIIPKNKPTSVDAVIAPLNNKTLMTKNKDSGSKSAGGISNSLVVCENSDDVSQSNQQVSRTDLSQSNYAVYCKLKNECSQVGLNIETILKDENIQKLLNDQEKLKNEAVVFLGTCKSDSGEILPVVHLLESEKKLIESINELQKNYLES